MSHEFRTIFYAVSFILTVKKIKQIRVELDVSFPKITVKGKSKMLKYLIWRISTDTQDTSIISHFCLSSFEIAYWAFAEHKKELLFFLYKKISV